MLGAWCILRDLDRILNLNVAALSEKPKDRDRDIPGNLKAEPKPPVGKPREGASMGTGRPGSAKG